MTEEEKEERKLKKEAWEDAQARGGMFGAGFLVFIIALVVTAIATYWKFLVVLAVAYVVYLILRRKLIFLAIVVVGFAFAWLDKISEEWLPVIVAEAVVSSEGAGEIEIYKQNKFTGNVVSTGNTITLAPGEKVKFLRTYHSYIEIQMPDGKKILVEGRNNGKSLFGKEQDGMVLIPPDSISIRAMTIFTREKRYSNTRILLSGYFRPENGVYQDIAYMSSRNVSFRLDKKPKITSKNNDVTSKKYLKGFAFSVYNSDDTFRRANHSITKNKEPIVIDGVPYNFSMSIHTEDKKVYDFVVTSTSSLVSKEGNIVYSWQNK